MHPNAQLIETFYTSFQQHNSAGMIACYAPEVVFNDPAFGELKGQAAKDMWQMLVERGKDLEVTFKDIKADDATGSAHWEATYTFSRSKRHVLNIIDASFQFQNGKIVRHTDVFDFWRWSRQALGLPGVLLGWSPIIQNAVRKQALKGLTTFQSERGQHA
jgi:ketosteroid isomerase-like protein